jgi:hypothetical protein
MSPVYFLHPPPPDNAGTTVPFFRHFLTFAFEPSFFQYPYLGNLATNLRKVAVHTGVNRDHTLLHILPSFLRDRQFSFQHSQIIDYRTQIFLLCPPSLLTFLTSRAEPSAATFASPTEPSSRHVLPLCPLSVYPPLGSTLPSSQQPRVQ